MFTCRIRHPPKQLRCGRVTCSVGQLLLQTLVLSLVVSGTVKIQMNKFHSFNRPFIEKKQGDYVGGS